ncbi:putative addiction module antidote protein [Massilia sp. MB5]|uniref:addiction module antidote protein n=1 Tax=Massilia sp. MB5 TaxID=2919578 RepID=UPI001F116F77|nr:addiction module antidote protein [Massilia sp. MB5]UMR32123.1 putative addiction module antidote protein [Massilia sp. MB5]
MNRSSRPHDKIVVELLREDPELADTYLAAALDEVSLDGGHQTLLAALRQVAEAQGMAAVAQHTGIPRESLYRTLSPTRSPTAKTLHAVLEAAGLKLTIQRV